MTPPRPRERPLRLFVRELPLVVGVVAALVLLWLWGEAMVLDGRMYGYGWPDYINNAWMIEHRVSVGYNNFRNPLHAAWLGALGESIGSYANAGIIISSLAVGAMVLSAGVLGRALAGPWAGGLAALSLPMVPSFLDAVRWSNYYPTLGAFTGIYLALCAALVRWPRLIIAALAGLAAGLAWGVDARGTLLLPAAGVLLLLAVSRRELSWPRRLLLVPLFCLSLPLGPWTKDTLWLGVHDPTWEERIRFQRQVIHRWVQSTHDDALIEQCPHPLPAGLIAAAQSACGQATLRYNLANTLPRNLPTGLLPVLLALPLTLLPGRQGWRGSLAGGAALIGSAGAMTVMAINMPLPDRYIIQLAVPMCVVVPVALARLCALLPRPLARWLTPLVLAAAAAWVWQVDPIERGTETKLQRSPRQRDMRDLTSRVFAMVRPGDEYLDCTLFSTTSAALPRLDQPSPPVLRPQELTTCQDWLDRSPPAGGSLWLALDPDLVLQDKRGVDGSVPEQKLSESITERTDWNLIFTQGSFQLWRHR